MIIPVVHECSRPGYLVPVPGTPYLPGLVLVPVPGRLYLHMVFGHHCVMMGTMAGTGTVVDHQILSDGGQMLVPALATSMQTQ